MKALKFLKHMKQTDTPYNFREWEMNKAIEELEKAMKPKTCLGCLHCNKAYQLTSCPPQYELNCGVFKTVFANDFKQYCSRYEPKDNT